MPLLSYNQHKNGSAAGDEGSKSPSQLSRGNTQVEMAWEDKVCIHLLK